MSCPSAQYCWLQELSKAPIQLWPSAAQTLQSVSFQAELRPNSYLSASLFTSPSPGHTERTICNSLNLVFSYFRVFSFPSASLCLSCSNPSQPKAGSNATLFAGLSELLTLPFCILVTLFTNSHGFVTCLMLEVFGLWASWLFIYHMVVGQKMFMEWVDFCSMSPAPIPSLENYLSYLVHKFLLKRLESISESNYYRLIQILCTLKDGARLPTFSSLICILYSGHLGSWLGVWWLVINSPPEIHWIHGSGQPPRQPLPDSEGWKHKGENEWAKQY